MAASEPPSVLLVLDGSPPLRSEDDEIVERVVDDDVGVFMDDEDTLEEELSFRQLEELIESMRLDDSAVLTGANAFDESSEHDAKQAMNPTAAIFVAARNFLNAQTIKPNNPLF